MARAQRLVLREGIVAGVISATVVAVWFLLFDLARGRPFLTPGLLGAAVFQGVNDPIGLQITAGPVIGYTVLHGLAFVAFGVVAASIMAVSEREPALFVAFVILFACFEVFFFGVVGALGKSMLGALVWWAILVGNLLASVAMLGYLLRAHRALPRTLVGSWGGVLREGVVAGLLGAMLIAGAERQPLLIFALVIFFTAFEVFFFGAVVIAAKWVLDELAGWTVFLGNLLATAAMLGYFFKGHRALAQRLTSAWADDD
jgi:hypothetical protein